MLKSISVIKNPHPQFYQSRMYKSIIFIFLFFHLVNGMASDISNSAVVEKKSTELFLASKWPDLVNYGNEAIAAGYDYFYLRMRVGIAYYNQKKYMKAVRHFEKAVKFNSSEETALEYLYYSYVFAGRAGEAKSLLSELPTTLKSKIHPPKNKYIQSVYAEGGVALSNLNNSYKTIDIDGSANVYGEATIIKNMDYWHIGINHELTNKLSIYQGYSNIKINFTRDIKTASKDTLNNSVLTQQDYYISGNLQLKGFSISPAFHLISVSSSQLKASYDKYNFKYVYNKKDTSFINYATSVSLTKNIGIYVCDLTVGFAQLNGLTQVQTGLALTYFPLTNTNLYGTSSITYMNESSTNRVIVAQKAGMKIINKLWAEAGITYGNLQNYSEGNAFVVYNTGDKILYKYGVALTSPLSKHFEFSIRYDCW
jgi:tetratricopeptide (TPR) repeat protein